MLFLTYDTKLHDGFGAQYQRMLGIYSICKEFGYGYVHTPFQSIEYQGLMALQKNKNDNSYVETVNRQFTFPSSGEIPHTFDRIIRKDLSLSELQELESLNENILIQYQFPYIISDKIPEIYLNVRGIYQPVILKNSIFTIGLHVRRGELNVIDSKRMLPNSFYIDTALKIVPLFKRYDIDFVIELYSEVPHNVIHVSPSHVGMNNRLKKKKSITPESSCIEDFDQLPNLYKCINASMFETFDRMINCDILIASRSSFSASASYLKNGLTVYHPFWHGMQPKDVSIKDSRWLQKVDDFIKTFTVNAS